MVGKRTFFTGLLLATLLTGCGDPVRDNANDPGSDRYHPNLFGTLSVTATKRDGSGIDGLSVQVDDRRVTTDSAGLALIPDLPVGQYTVRFVSTQYVIDSTTLTIQSGDTTFWSRQLNATPQFDSVSVTCELRPASSANRTGVRFFARVSDPDGSGDLPTAAVLVATPFDTLSMSRVDSATWQRIDTTSIKWSAWDLVGLPIYFVAKDQPPSPFGSGQTVSMVATLARVFNANPVIISPTAATVIRSLLNVQWGPSQGDFGFAYSNRINFIKTDQSITYTFTNIPQDSTHYSLHDSVATGNYNWYVEEVDLFGNSSRSDVKQIQITNN